MSAALTLNDLTVPMRALRALAVDFAYLPAPAVSMSRIYPKRLELSLHQGLGPFDVWRTALGIEPEAVRFRAQGDGRTWSLKALGEFAGAEVELVAYGDALDSVLQGAESGGGDA
ncbi:hypothetical protein [Streptomyces sp. V4I2]|uniref:hypothetical protein n=1 Tax=Streptomyces sp. V4I2 TaxID=3042280 RepID=UPI002782F9DA|nr:hypothetical protein [Streptomyces sp. V4I2]MDQ1047385.1 hypothetical protein [Streptomyces sp. V4I2]